LILGFDTETPGLDARHGCWPFLVTTCTDTGDQRWFEWDVDPFTRLPQVVKGDLDEICDMVAQADLVVGHNLKFDITGMAQLTPKFIKALGDWKKLRDTLYGAHLLSSGRPKDLTSVVVDRLGYNMERFEVALERATKAARDIAIREFPTWMIAKEGLPMLPSSSSVAEERNKEEKVWRADYWVPRAVAKAKGYHWASSRVVNLRQEKFDVRIDRTTKWGNPFIIGKDGDRDEVIAKYREWVVEQPALMESLGELDDKSLGCFCKPEACHGDVLADLVNRRLSHPWWFVCSDYANPDSASVVPLWKSMEAEIEERKLWPHFHVAMTRLRIFYEMEEWGVPANYDRLYELKTQFQEESETLGRKMKNIARSYGGRVPCKAKVHTHKKPKPCGECNDTMVVDFDLDLPKGAVNNSLRTFCFDILKLPHVRNPKSETNAPSLDSKNAIPHYQTILKKGTKERLFVDSLASKRMRDTALTFIDSYESFWLPLAGDERPNGRREWMIIHPSFNPTGTATLRGSCKNPNAQQWSKRAEINVRYIYGPEPGREWWSCDAKNLELRIPAYECGEQSLIDLFEAADSPPFYGSEHLLNFSIVYPDVWELELPRQMLNKEHIKKKYADTYYQWCKNGDFAVGYGAVDKSDGTGTADRTFRVPGAHRRLKESFAKKEKLNSYWIKYAREYGYVETIPDTSVDPERGYPLECPRTEGGYILPTAPLNYHVQGTACWWMMMAMMRIQDQLDEWNREVLAKKPRLANAQDWIRRHGYYMVANIHDEVVFSFPKKGDPRIDKKSSNLGRIRKLQKLMEEGGRCIGVPTPTSAEYHPETFKVGISF
jgi:hypothetical protein